MKNLGPFEKGALSSICVHVFIFSLLGAQDYRGGNARVKWGQEMGQADMGGEFQEAHIVQVACRK